MWWVLRWLWCGNESCRMDKDRNNNETALCSPWSVEEYDRWMREQDERDEAERDSANVRILARFDPECEAAVRALEDVNWGCQARSGWNR